MPIRMVDDPQDPKRNNTNNNKKRGGVPPALLLLLPSLLKFLFKRPKLLIGVIVIAGLFYFFGGNLTPEQPSSIAEEEVSADFSTGLNMSQEMYDKSEIFEPLVAGYKNQLPSQVSLEQYCPDRLNQGSQGSCVGWSSSYAARTILESRNSGLPPNQVAFSPSSLYNQIRLPNCQGAYIHTAMKVMKERGVLPFQEFKYNQYDCERTPSRNQMSRANQFRTRGFQRLWENEGGTDILAIKQNIAQGAPVVVGMLVGGSFMNAMQGKAVWRPTRTDYRMRGFGGHAMCLVGYDDNKEGGAFQIMNSWGENWGDDGFCWVRYSDFEHFTREAYGLYPMGNAERNDPNKLAVDFGLVENSSMSNIPLSMAGQHNGVALFRTSRAVPKGTRFKIEVSNSVECYVYIIGEETDGSNYVLFPYTEKHSPYCGITGTRLFPRNQSLMIDDLGSRDRMAVIVSKVPLDINYLNTVLNQIRGTFLQDLTQVLEPYTIRQVKFQSGNVIHFDAITDGNKAVAMLIEVDKN
ncbi:MAG: peptidase C1 [Bacteroidia bacterium]|nr:peptidase C1 [Bacteroidia bacterium]